MVSLAPSSPSSSASTAHPLHPQPQDDGSAIPYKTLEHLTHWLSDDAGCITAAEKEAKVRGVLAEYDIERTAHTIAAYSRESPQNDQLFNVALQFPDALLPTSPLVSQLLDTCLHHRRPEKDFFVYILGDTSYNECCVDEVNANHLETHVIVHYGVACMAAVKSLPVLYVLPRATLPRSSPADVTSSLRAHLSNICRGRQGNTEENGKEKEIRDAVVDDTNKLKKIIVLYDLDLAHLFNSPPGEESVCLDTSAGKDVEVEVAALKIKNPYDLQLPPKPPSPDGDGVMDSTSTETTPARKDRDEERILGHLLYHTSEAQNIAVSNVHFVWVTALPAADDGLLGTISEGESYGAKALRNGVLALTTGPRRSCGLSVVSVVGAAERDDVTAERVLRRRFALLQRVEAAQRVGILVNTTATRENSVLIDRTVRMLEAAGKFAYILVVGRLNEAKLANFADIDLFVLVSCAQNHLLPAALTRLVMQPILTPYELRCALRDGGDQHFFNHPYCNDVTVGIDEELDELDARGAGAEGVIAKRGSEDGQWSVAKVAQHSGALSAGEFLATQRTWKGLSYSAGGDDDGVNIEDLSLTIEQGQHGIASGYDRELSDSGRSGTNP